MKQHTVAERYNELAAWRSTALSTGRTCAALTLPYLLPPEGSTRSNTDLLRQPWQSVGSRGANIMASKLLLASLPTNTSFFKLQVSDGEFVKDERLNREIRSDVDLVLSQMEQIINQEINNSNDRTVLFHAFKHLVVTGNVLIFDHDNDGKQVFPLSRYVVDRDGNGNWTEIIAVEAVDRKLLPEEFQRPEDTDDKRVNHTGNDGSRYIQDLTAEEDEVIVFTYVVNDGKNVEWYQEAEDRMIPGSSGRAKTEESPWYPLRFNIVDGEDYGRGRIEEYLGDLRSLDALMKAVIEGGAGTAKTIWLVSPSAMVTPAALAEAGNNAIIAGREGDVTTIKADRGGDFQVALTLIQDLTQRLNEAFLIFSPRQSERTTAEEIRAMQQELNEQLGGQMGQITTDLLQPYLRRLLVKLQKKKKLPSLPDGIVMPTVVTGLSGIGRGQDVQALTLFLQTVAQGLGPETLMQYVNPDEYMKRLATAMGVDPLNLIKDQEALQQERQQAAEQQRQQALTEQAGQFAQAEAKVQSESMRNDNTQDTQAPSGPGAEAGPQRGRNVRRG